MPDRAEPSTCFIELGEHTAVLARARLDTGPRLITDLREIWLGDPGTAPAEIGEFFRSVSPAEAVVLLRPRGRSVLRATPDQAVKINGPAAVRQLLLSRFGPAGESAAWAWCASDTGFPPTAGQVWLLDVLLAPGGGEAFDQLQDWGITPLRCQSSRLTMAGALAGTIGTMPADLPLLLCDLGETRTDLLVITGAGLAGFATVAAGLGLVVDTLQAALDLRMRGTALRLLFGQGYDFAELAPKLVRPLANQLKPALAGLSKRPVRLVCSGLGDGQAWAVNALGEALGLKALTLDTVAWAKARGLAFADHVRSNDLPPAWLGLLSTVAAFDPDDPAGAVPWQPAFQKIPAPARRMAPEAPRAAKIT